MKMTSTDIDTRRAEIKTTGEHRAALIAVYKDTGTGTPAETVAALVARLGYDTAAETVAELVNSVSEYDGRIHKNVREWAENHETAASRDELEERGFYTPSDIHPAHIQQIGAAMMEYTPVEEPAAEVTIQPTEDTTNEPAPNIYERMTAELDARVDRSAWGRGVNLYALELVEELKERADYEKRNPTTAAECREWLLNGAQDWSEYSYGGSALIYDGDIAERLCNPSELKKTRGGERNPNSRETWLDVQARALFQAGNRATRLYSHIIKEI